MSHVGNEYKTTTVISRMLTTIYMTHLKVWTIAQHRQRRKNGVGGAKL